MRVIAGSAKGRPLRAPTSMSTRPMADRVKESLFNILAGMGYPQETDRVLDLYAGTGSLGIEALSRSAAWCDFVEQASAPGGCITANLASTALTAGGKLYPISVAAFLRGADTLTRRAGPAHNAAGYDIIFCDPPYADPTIPALLEQLGAWPGLNAGGVLVFGHATQVVLPDAVGRLARVRYRKWGGSAFSLYRPADDVDTERAGVPGAVDEEEE